VSDVKAVIGQSWQPGFRHSAGRLGSHFIRAMRDRQQLLGWKTERLGVSIPPLAAGGQGEWVEIGPGATLVGYAPPDDLAPGDVEPGKVFAAVRVDGADNLLYVLVACETPAALVAGLRLQPVFSKATDTGSVLPVFEPVVAAA